MQITHKSEYLTLTNKLFLKSSKLIINLSDFAEYSGNIYYSEITNDLAEYEKCDWGLSETIENLVRKK